MTSSIPQSDMPAIRGIPGIAEAQPLVLGSTQAAEVPFLLVVGVESRHALAGNVSLVEGRWISETGAELLLGTAASNRMRHTVGDRLLLGRQKFSISGRFRSESNMLNQAAILALPDAQHVLKSEGRVNLIFLKLDNTRGIREIARALSSRFPDLQLTRTVDLLGRIEFFVTVDRIASVFALIAILFCILITTNTLIMALVERRREIGILIAIGWSRWMIATSLLLESLMITTSGGLLGMLSGTGLLYAYSQSDIPRINWGTPEFTLQYLFTVASLCVLTGLLSALYPILLSLRLTPAEILQRDS